jgi:hypothetical protein
MKRAIIRVYDKHLDWEHMTESRKNMLRTMREQQISELDLLIAKRAAFEGHAYEAIEHLTRANRTIRSPKLTFAALALRLRPQWVGRFINWRYGAKYLDLS